MVVVGTFNLNNLFTRFNFSAEIPEDQGGDGEALQASYSFSDPDQVRIRRYQGRLVNGKDQAGRTQVAQRLLGSHPAIQVAAPQVDVWAVQEVEDIDTLRFFAATELGGAYPHVVLIEGNDPRLIDLAVLSRLPLGAVTSWQHAVHPDNPSERVFGRDLLEVQVLTPDRAAVAFTVFNNHLKSHFVPFDEPDPVAAAARANLRRRQQAQTIARIVTARMQPADRYVIAGDMNDPPASEFLAPLTAGPLGLVDALTAPTETRPAKADTPPPASRAWTHRFKQSGRPARYELFDHLWLSPALADTHDGAWIIRRRSHGGTAATTTPPWSSSTSDRTTVN